jgi:predicted Rdx family selenoprotein
VNTARVRALTNGQISNVVLTFRVDSIAQELNETFTLKLEPLVQPNPRTGGLFFQDTIQVTIVDSDSKENTH